ncbi:MAG: DUF1499 domain-containing protein [Gemmatimonadota bacterium]|jgi:uncharacterized protein (DUF1499 family)
MKLSRRILLGLTQNVAFTASDAEDARLRGRTLAVPFEDVWQAARHVITQQLGRWTLLEEDDEEGLLRAEARGLLGHLVSGITIRIILDRNAQTRIDAMSALREGRADFGANARRLARFFRLLDRRLEAMRRASRTDA